MVLSDNLKIGKHLVKDTADVDTKNFASISPLEILFDIVGGVLAPSSFFDIEIRLQSHIVLLDKGEAKIETGWTAKGDQKRGNHVWLMVKIRKRRALRVELIFPK